MGNRWEEKKKKTRKYKKGNHEYTKWDMFFDILFWIPEVLIWPVRLLFLLFRAIGKFLGDIFSLS